MSVSNSAFDDVARSSREASLRWAGRSVPSSSARRSRGSPASNRPPVSEIA